MLKKVTLHIKVNLPSGATLFEGLMGFELEPHEFPALPLKGPADDGNGIVKSMFSRIERKVGKGWNRRARTDDDRRKEKEQEAGH